MSFDPIGVVLPSIDAEKLSGLTFTVRNNKLIPILRDGTELDPMECPPGKTGVGIENAYITQKITEEGIKNILHLVYTDGTDKEAGEVGGGSATAPNVSYSNDSHKEWTSVQKALDGIIDKIEYIKPVITAFNMSPSTTDYEIGQSVNNLSFNWSYNKTIKTQSLTDATLADETIRTYNWSGNLTSNKTFTLSASDGENSVTANKSISFKHKIYVGAATLPDEFTSEFILNLEKKSFATTYRGTYNVNAGAGKYAFVACPASWNMPNNCKIGGFGTDLIDCGTIAFTNASGNTTNFKIVRTSQANLGSISMVFE